MVTDCGHTGLLSCGRCDACKGREGQMRAAARAAETEERQRLAARTRRTDPATSHVAAAGVKVNENQTAVLFLLRVLGEPVLDEELIAAYERRKKALKLPDQSTSGIRSRRAELAAGGYLLEGEKKRMSTGGMGRTFTIRPKDPS